MDGTLNLNNGNAGGILDLSRVQFLAVQAGHAIPVDPTGPLLEGTGTVNANVTNLSGAVKGGDSPGKLTINGSYTQNALGTMLDQLGGFSAGQSDLLDVLGTPT